MTELSKDLFEKRSRSTDMRWPYKRDKAVPPTNDKSCSSGI